MQKAVYYLELDGPSLVKKINDYLRAHDGAQVAHISYGFSERLAWSDRAIVIYDGENL